MKFATIAVIAIAATTAEAGTCGKVYYTTFSDKDCKKVDKKFPVLLKDFTLPLMSKNLDRCIATGGAGNYYVSCDTTGVVTQTFKDAKCKTANEDKKTAVWGVCKKSVNGYELAKGAEALKMAVTGAALALVASQF